jgi:hypothetical protein
MPTNSKQVTRDFLNDNPDVIESTILVAAAKSYGFFSSIDDKVCPLNPQGIPRPDFSSAASVRLYMMIRSYWKLWENAPACLAPDSFMDMNYVGRLIASDVELGRWSHEEGVKVWEYFEEEYKSLNFAPEVIAGLAQSPQVLGWCARKAGEHLVDTLMRERMSRPITTEDVLERATTAHQPHGPNVMAHGSAADILLDSSAERLPAIPTGLRGLDMALGGGLRYTSTTLIAGTNGSGKTVLATQLGRHYVLLGLRVLFISTEESPQQLLARMLSGYLKVPINEFIDMKPAPGMSYSDMQHMVMQQPLIPAHIAEQHRDRIEAFREASRNRLWLWNWSEGEHSVRGELPVLLRKLKQERDFVPQVLIFDWIGRGLGGADTMSTSTMDVRHHFNAAMGAIASDTIANRRISVVLCQLNQGQVKHSTKWVDMSMTGESKSLSDRVQNFIGMTSLKIEDDNRQMLSSPIQFLCVAKCRYGDNRRSSVGVRTNFRIQTFEDMTKSS